MKKLRKIIKIVITVLIFFCILSYALVGYFFKTYFGRAEKANYQSYLVYEDFSDFDREIVKFVSGKNTLTGYIYGKENKQGVIVIAHGLGGGAENYISETKYFVDKGWCVFTYDATGSHESEGKGTMGLPQSAIDLHNALLYLESDENLNNLPILLYGHSWGGYAVTAVLNYNHDIAGVVSVAGFNNPIEMLMKQGTKILGFFAYVEYPFIWSIQYFRFGNNANLTAIDGINKSIDTKIMIIHGDKDTTVNYDGAAIINNRDKISNPNVIFKTMVGKDHSNMFKSEDANNYIDEKNMCFLELYNEYNGKIPKDLFDDFYNNLDRHLTSQLNENFFNEVNEFFLDAIK